MKLTEEQKAEIMTDILSDVSVYLAAVMGEMNISGLSAEDASIILAGSLELAATNPVVLKNATLILMRYTDGCGHVPSRRNLGVGENPETSLQGIGLGLSAPDLH